MKWIGIDLGGSWIKGAVVDKRGQLFTQVKAATPVQEGREGILGTLHKIIHDLLGSSDPTELVGIGIGSAGRIDRKSGTVVYATENLPGWTGTDIRAELEKVHKLPVYVDNDVNAAALGEAWLGAVRDVKSFLFVALGTGVGGAFYDRGEVLSGQYGGAAEIGHMILYPQGTSCNCGQRGCLEQYVSGTALNRRAKAIRPDWGSFDLIEAYRQGTPQAIAGIKPYIEDLAIGMISLQSLFDPQTVVLGGGVSETFPLWEQELRKIIKQCSGKSLNIVPALLGNQAGILGAVKLAINSSAAATSP